MGRRRSGSRGPRLFVALRFPDPVHEALEALTWGVPDASWGPSSQYHLTLRFVGDPAPLATDDVARALRGVRAPAFRLALRGTGHFPLRDDPEILWVGVEESEALTTLRNRVEAALRRAGLPPEGRNFHPHVTLANVKASDPRAVGEFHVRNGLFRVDDVPATEFVLCSSVLKPGGAEHTVEEAYPLESEVSG